MCSAVRTQNEVGAKQEPFATVGRSADALDARLRPEATSLCRRHLARTVHNLQLRRAPAGVWRALRWERAMANWPEQEPPDDVREMRPSGCLIILAVMLLAALLALVIHWLRSGLS
jgi:hypothetical protein